MIELPSNVQVYLETRHGLRANLLVKVEWIDDNWTTYQEDLMVVTEIQDTVTSNDKVVGTVQVTVSDCAEDLLSYNFHRRPAKVCILLDATEVLLFSGEVSSPFTLQGKNVTFSILRQIESTEVGFTPEIGQLAFVPDHLVNNVWPLGFGTVIQAPAVKVGEAKSMKLETLLTLVDPTLLYKFNQAVDAYYAVVYERSFWLETIKQNEDLIGTLAQDYVDETDFLSGLFATVETTLNDVEVETDALDQNPNDLVLRANLTAAKANYQAAVNALDAANIYVRSIDKVVEAKWNKYLIRRQASRLFLNSYSTERDALRKIEEIQIEQCMQSSSENPNQRVQSSEGFDQDIEQFFIINGVKFRGYVSGQDLYLAEGPIETHTNVAVESWAEDEEAECDVTLESYGMFRCLENLEGKWLLVNSTNCGVNERHIIKVVRQVNDKVYFNLIPWSSDRFNQVDKIDPESFIGMLVDLPQGNPGTWPNTTWSGSFNPALWNRRETARYLFLLAQLVNPTDEQKNVLARLVIMEPWDAVVETAITIFAASARSTYTVIGEDILEVEAACGTIPASWLSYDIPFEEIPESIDWRAEPGTEVFSDQACTIHIANSLPSTILGVFAYRRNTKGENYLSPLPTTYYTKLEAKDMGSMVITALVVQPLPPDWEDTIYVTYTSSIGPRLTDILSYLIETYTDKSIEPASFGLVETLFRDKYPLNFALYDRMNVLELIRQLAWENRCRCYLKDDQFKIEYLSYEPDPVATLGDDSIIINTEQHTINETEEIKTKFIGLWKPNYLPTTIEQRFIVRYNTKIHGIMPYDHTYLSLNIKRLVEKTSTFWLIRYSNSFKRVVLMLPISGIVYEIGDCLTYNSLPCVVVEKSYNEHNVYLTLELPVRLGETEQYDYYWPSSLHPDVPWPLVSDTEAVGFGPNSDVRGNITCND